MNNIQRKTIRLLTILAFCLIIPISGCTGSSERDKRTVNAEKKPPVEKETPTVKPDSEIPSEQPKSGESVDSEQVIRDLAIDWLVKIGYDKETLDIGQANFRTGRNEAMWNFEITNETGSFCRMGITEESKIIRMASFADNQNQLIFVPGDIVERLDKALGLSENEWKRFEWNPDKASAYFRKYAKSGDNEICIGEIRLNLSEDKKSMRSYTDNEMKLNESFPINVDRDTAIKNALDKSGGASSKVLHAELVQRPIQTPSGELNAVCWEIILDNSTSTLIRADNGESPN
ncbi:MAG: hypothetical protein ABIC40_03285 [bacterium]